MTTLSLIVLAGLRNLRRLVDHKIDTDDNKWSEKEGSTNRAVLR